MNTMIFTMPNGEDKILLIKEENVYKDPVALCAKKLHKVSKVAQVMATVDHRNEATLRQYIYRDIKNGKLGLHLDREYWLVQPKAISNFHKNSPKKGIFNCWCGKAKHVILLSEQAIRKIVNYYMGSYFVNKLVQLCNLTKKILSNFAIDVKAVFTNTTSNAAKRYKKVCSKINLAIHKNSSISPKALAW